MSTATAPAPTRRHPPPFAQLPQRILQLEQSDDRAMASWIFVVLLHHPDGLTPEGIRGGMCAGIDDDQAFYRLLDTMVEMEILDHRDQKYHIARCHLLAA